MKDFEMMYRKLWKYQEKLSLLLSQTLFGMYTY